MEISTKKILMISRVFLIPGAYEQYPLFKKYSKDNSFSIIVPKKLGNVPYMEDYQEEADAGVYTSKLVFLKKNSPLAFFTHLLKLLIKIKPDIIYSEEEPWYLTSFQICLLSKIFLPKTKIIIFTWENICRKNKFPLNLFEKFSYYAASKFIAGNEGAKGVLIKKGYNKEYEKNLKK
mgnify:CR=1 FL=1